MAFTPLPRRVSSFAQGAHADLVAVLGTYRRDMSIRIGIAGDELLYSTRLFGSQRRDGATDSVWLWGSGTPAPGGVG